MMRAAPLVRLGQDHAICMPGDNRTHIAGLRLEQGDALAQAVRSADT